MIKQSSLQKFQEEMGAVQKDPYRVVMRQSKLPMSLLHDRVKAHVSTVLWRLSDFYLFVLCCLYNGPCVLGRPSRWDMCCLCELTPFSKCCYEYTGHIKLLTFLPDLYNAMQMTIMPQFSSVACFLRFYGVRWTWGLTLILIQFSLCPSVTLSVLTVCLAWESCAQPGSNSSTP